MADPEETNRIIRKAAISAAKTAAFSQVFSEPAVDMDGHAALNVTLVVDSKAQKLDGDAALDIIVQIQRDLQKAGDERFAVVEFVTEDELA